MISKAMLVQFCQIKMYLQRPGYSAQCVGIHSLQPEPAVYRENDGIWFLFSVRWFVSCGEKLGLAPQ